MAKNLVIVESPAKAKTIEKYLGKDFVVKASYGHVRDLPKKDDAIDIEANFEPKYEVLADKKDVIKELKKLAKESETVYLATDEDREGEAISWHLAEVLGLDVKLTRRIVYHEISKKAIQAALENPRFIDINLVNAQQARRVLDRLVGFQLSPILWRKLKGGLSAGRVQSVAVRLIVEREREINDFQTTSSFKITAEFLLDGGVILKAELPKKFDREEEVNEFLQSCVNAEFKISDLETKPGRKSPSAPFITSTLQQEASRKLSFSVAQTMRVAQSLYENGHITYMRTDSVNLSDTALSEAGDVIKKEYGPDYHQVRKYKTKNSGAQEAHEAIRPTNLSAREVPGERNEMRLYDLIWKRTIASQMADARLEKTVATIDISTNPNNLQASGEVLVFDGFLKVYLEGQDDEGDDEEQEGVLPPLKVGQKLALKEILARERFTRPAPRYTEASLVKKLEELGIGRPSTYAPTISTVQKRNYVEKANRDGVQREFRSLKLKDGKISSQTLEETTGAEKSKLFPTDLGMMVTDFLMENFPSILDYSFTASVEEEFDEIAAGAKEWNKMIGTFYTDFSTAVKDTSENADRVRNERELGTDPKSGEPVFAKFGRYGPYVQIGSGEGEEKPKYASLLANQRLDTITLEEAMDLFKMPRNLGEWDGHAVKANIGRFGPYVQFQKVYASVPKDEDVFTITFDRAKELIIAKQEAAANMVIKEIAEDCQVLRGRFGPYVKMRGKNLRIPKGVEPESLTLEACEELFNSQKDKPKRGGGGARKKKS
ncbi:MAG: type I DNA topoisomerase [Bacteroidia bacterium]|nr:type I DNA topoisomerase [Bacteroidia bacterium]